VVGGRCVSSRGRVVRLLLGVDRGALVGDLGDVTVVVISGVGNGLDSAVGKGNLVGTGNVTGRIGGLAGLEVSLGVVIGNTVLESIRLGDLLLLVVGSGGVVDGRCVVSRGSMDNRCVVSRGSVDNRCVVSRGSVDNRGVIRSGSIRSGVVDWGMDTVVSNDMGSRGVVGQAVVGNRGTVVGTAMVDGGGDDSVSAMSVSVGGLDLRESLVVVHLVDRSVAGTEGLGLLEVSYLTVSLCD